jgi:site-specific DNA-methyltransferase (adenine-specific)
MMKEPLSRLDHDQALRAKLKPCCRLRPGEVWTDPVKGHRVGVLDAADTSAVARLMDTEKAVLAIHDPPYNFRVGTKKRSNSLSSMGTEEYIASCRKWIRNSLAGMKEDSSLYVWLGADQRKGFQPLPEFMMMMREFKEFTPKNFITVRNQRGYGTQKNWMSVRQELLYYTKGNPPFSVVYTGIPKVLKGYYKTVDGKVTENLERSRAETIRPGNVWLDVQQVFYRLEENVPGAYAQKPLSAVDRIILSGSSEGDRVIDFFCHSGTTLISAEKLRRRCFTCDIDPIFAELAIRRLERFRQEGKTGWQCDHPFPEISEPGL